jgi:hypothetical protein
MNNKYITIEEGEDYRSIATKMTNMGYKMNHATARNILLSGMKKFVAGIAAELGQSIDSADAERLIMRQDIHEVVGDLLVLCNKEETSQCPVVIQQ